MLNWPGGIRTASNMDPIPYPHFWHEAPEIHKRAWRPTDESRRKLGRFWFIQTLLLLALLGVGALLAVESKRQPPIYAKLPNGLVFETSATPLQMDRLARVDLVNQVLPLLYYQGGASHFLEAIRQNVKPDILRQFQAEMQMAKYTNTTVSLQIAETFQTLYVRNQGFEAMTKGYLAKRSSRENASAPIYVRTRWLWNGHRYVLSRITEVKPADYSEAFLLEKERLRRLPKEELERELAIKQDTEIVLPKRNPLF